MAAHVVALLRAGVAPASIAVISPYAAQVSLLSSTLAAAASGEAGASSVGVATVDSCISLYLPMCPCISPCVSLYLPISHCISQVEVATVDSFQGREADAVVLSLVRSNPAGRVGAL